MFNNFLEPLIYVSRHVQSRQNNLSLEEATRPEDIENFEILFKNALQEAIADAPADVTPTSDRKRSAPHPVATPSLAQDLAPRREDCAPVSVPSAPLMAEDFELTDGRIAEIRAAMERLSLPG